MFLCRSSFIWQTYRRLKTVPNFRQTANCCKNHDLYCCNWTEKTTLLSSNHCHTLTIIFTSKGKVEQDVWKLWRHCWEWKLITLIEKVLKVIKIKDLMCVQGGYQGQNHKECCRKYCLAQHISWWRCHSDSYTGNQSTGNRWLGPNPIRL